LRKEQQVQVDREADSGADYGELLQQFQEAIQFYEDEIEECPGVSRTWEITLLKVAEEITEDLYGAKETIHRLQVELKRKNTEIERLRCVIDVHQR